MSIDIFFNGVRTINLRDLTDEILTIKEASQFLKIGKTTLYKLAREKRNTSSKNRREWHFVKTDLVEWPGNTEGN